MSTMWYYAKDGVSLGPTRQEDLRRDLQSGALEAGTLVWTEEMTDWQPAHQISALQAGPPPPPSGDVPPVRLNEPRYERRQSISQIQRGTAASDATPSDATPSDGQASPTLGSDGLYVLAPSRNFGEAISVCLGKYVTFSGRASRSEYWFFYLFSLIIGVVATIFQGGQEGLISGLATLALLLPSWAVTVRRLHDTNRSGWWLGAPILSLFVAVAAPLVFFGITPGAGALTIIAGLAFFAWAIALLVFLCTKGDPGPNRFG